MALFGRKKKARGPLPAPLDPKWKHGGEGRFPRFLDLDPEAAGLTKASGVFVIWHTGSQPGWVYVGASDDLAADFYKLGDDEEILQFRNRGSLYCSWTFIREEFQGGVQCYLTIALKPKVENPLCPEEDDVDLVPVLPPGMTLEQLEAMFSGA